jgi:SAM-dependent methyltransferase
MSPVGDAPQQQRWSLDGPPAAVCGWCGAVLSPGELTGRIRCATCGVETTSPWPTPAQLDAAYGDWYRPTGGRFGRVGDAILRRTRSRLAGRIDRLAPDGPVLDVGAGDLTLVDELRRAGRAADGLDPYSGVPGVRTEQLSELPGPYAAIVFWHSLEHLPAPHDALRQATALLAPGGLLVIALPNADSLQAKAFGDRWFALDLPRHLVHVPADTLLAAVAALGLRTTRVSHLRGGQVAFGWVHGLTGRISPRLDLYGAIRTGDAQEQQLSAARRLGTLALASLLAPVGLVAALVEVMARRGGSVYIEARR